MTATATSTAEILALYDRFGSDRYDEAVSQMDHALQTAARAVAAGASEPLIVAALLHDVGHLLDLATTGREQTDLPSRDLGHEVVGARYLATQFPPSVTGPVALHVRAKRYRCAVDPTYRAQLSAGSKRSLERQGGPLDAVEVARFEQHPCFAAAVALRGWDDEGKVDGLAVVGLDDYRALLERVAAG